MSLYRTVPFLKKKAVREKQKSREEEVVVSLD